jgi:hypothetical protein
MITPRKRNVHGIIGALVLVVAQVMMLNHVEPFLSWFYALAWWSYILIIDSVVYRLKGNSLIVNRTREFFLMIVWSFTIWLFFEMVNLVMRNWYYINVPNSGLVRFVGYGVSYGTVLPGIFETTELLETLGLFRRAPAPPFRMSQRWFVGFLITGGLFLILPLVVSRYTFPLIWGSFIFLLEPINYRLGGKSLLADWERGSLRKFYLLLVAGLICGFVWEFWNFWARTKWIYTVPFFDELKLFEMPVLGFLGFPPFAVECYIIYNFISLWRHKRGWEQDVFMIHPARKTSRSLKVVTAVCLVLFYVMCTKAIDRYTIHSTMILLDDFPPLTTVEREKMGKLGIETVDDLLWRTRTPEATKRMLADLQLTPDRLADVIRQAVLADLKGLGADHFVLLKKVGVDSVAGLAREVPEGLHEKLVNLEEWSAIARPPTRAEVKLWIMEARRRIGR